MDDVCVPCERFAICRGVLELYCGLLGAAFSKFGGSCWAVRWSSPV